MYCIYASGLNNFATHLDEDDPISFCFYHTPEFHRKHDTTRQESQSLWTILRHDVFLIIPIDTIRTYIEQPNRISLSLVIMHWNWGRYTGAFQHIIGSQLFKASFMRRPSLGSALAYWDSLAQEKGISEKAKPALQKTGWD